MPGIYPGEDVLIFEASVPALSGVVGREIVFLPDEAAPAIVDGEGGDGGDGLEIVVNEEQDATGDEHVGIVDAGFVLN